MRKLPRLLFAILFAGFIFFSLQVLARAFSEKCLVYHLIS